VSGETCEISSVCTWRRVVGGLADGCLRGARSRFLAACCRSPRRAGTILFVVALAVRLTILAFFDHNIVHPDSNGYHRLAVNLVHGHGLSLQNAQPFERSFLREPGYPVFLAAIYAVVDRFDPVEDIQDYDRQGIGRLNRCYPEIVVAKTVQATMDAAATVLVFSILAMLAAPAMAFVSALAYALFINSAFNSLFLLREALVVFLLLVLNLLYLKYLSGEAQRLWLALIGAATGLLILVFQFHVVILPVFFALVLARSRQFWTTVRHTALVGAVAVAVVAPHGLAAYRFYPDVRIFKTCGVSLTHEMLAYYGAALRAQYYGVLTAADTARVGQECNRSSREQFERSFNGYYASRTAALEAAAPEGLVSRRKVMKYLSHAKNALCHTQIGRYARKDMVRKYGALAIAQSLGIPIVIGLLGLAGAVAYGQRQLVFLLPVVTYALFFWILGSENRRMIILQPFLIYFALLFLRGIALRWRTGGLVSP
jgi:hypothetical protein